MELPEPWKLGTSYDDRIMSLGTTEKRRLGCERPQGRGGRRSGRGKTWVMALVPTMLFSGRRAGQGREKRRGSHAEGGREDGCAEVTTVAAQRQSQTAHGTAINSAWPDLRF